MDRHLKLIIGNPTQNGTDGQIADLTGQPYPINVIVNTAIANSTLQKIAIRCDDGYETVGNWEISFIGDTAARWEVADGAAYPTEESAQYAQFTSTLTNNATVTNRNHVVWLRASTDGTEPAQVDTSVQVRIYGRCVPSGGV